jgi:hypothetical protein
VPIATLDDLGRLQFNAPADETIAPVVRHLARHEFSDTRHRLVKYRLTATTRFREYFPESVTSNVENLIAVRAFPELVVPSSARPAPPNISYVVPVFGWTKDGQVSRDIRSTRRGGGLRVYLGETWYSSGEGEQLAVIEAPGHNRWGADPLARPSSVTSSDVRPVNAPARAPGSEYDNKVHPYDVHFDDDHQQWYSDVIFGVGDLYFPFRQLSLARYQPHSLNGLHLSTVVEAGIHQLAPDRILTLAWGAAPPAPAGQVRISITVAALASTPPVSPAAAVDPTRGAFVEVAIEERDIARRDWDECLGWKPAPQAQQPVMDRPPSATQPWSGHVLLSRSTSVQRRFVVREYEVFAVNASPVGQDWIDNLSAVSRRVVYADTVLLD